VNSSTRDTVQEIADIRKRRRFGPAIVELSLRLQELEQALNRCDRDNTELVRYFPVALVGCIEGYFRLVIKELIDAGDPFLTNAEKLASMLKFDFALLRAVHGKAITVGELVAHSVKLSRLEHIESSVTRLLGTSFLQEMRTVTDRWDHEVKGNPATPILTNPDVVFARVSKTFELRHIICHEIASGYEITSDDVEQCFESCVLFLRAADESVAGVLYPGAALTQAEMNVAASKSLDEARERLSGRVDELRALLSDAQLPMFEVSQTQWQIFSDSWSACVAGDRTTGGTIWPVVRSGVATASVDRRTSEISSFIEALKSR